MTEKAEVLVIGGGPAGLSASIFTARAGLDSVVVDSGGSILRRNAALENFPGFPWGIDARLLLSLMAEQAELAGAERREDEIERLHPAEAGFVGVTASGAELRADRVICATKNAVGYLDDVPEVTVTGQGKDFVETDGRGRTGVPGLYAAGRLAGKPHQAIVAAGHGAEVGVTLIEDADVPFYHDWVAPVGYFTGRGRDVPPGCEEIDDSERERRARSALRSMRERLDAATLEPPVQHPSVATDRE